jgi:hypothetical protein
MHIIDEEYVRRCGRTKQYRAFRAGCDVSSEPGCWLYTRGSSSYSLESIVVVADDALAPVSRLSAKRAPEIAEATRLTLD